MTSWTVMCRSVKRSCSTGPGTTNPRGRKAMRGLCPITERCTSGPRVCHDALGEVAMTEAMTALAVQTLLAELTTPEGRADRYPRYAAIRASTSVAQAPDGRVTILSY